MYSAQFYHRVLACHSDKSKILLLSVYCLHPVCLVQLFTLYFSSLKDVRANGLIFTLVFVGYGGFPPGVPPPTNV